MRDTSTDAELVAGHLAGDRTALAAIYDRYADSLYDTAAAMTRRRHDAADVVQDVFVAAAERMGQLRDPDKLKPWLFAILRNEVYRRSGKQRRTIATDFSDPVVEMSAPSQPADDGSNVEYEELAALVRAASAGLDERDQLILELSVRQGLQGDDLADALGVTPQQCYGLVHRMRQRTERTLGAFCVARSVRSGRQDCPELAEILRDWDGEFSVLVRKRVARHVDRCETCERSRRTLAPFALFGAAPAFAAPADLRDRVLGAASRPPTALPYTFEAPGGFPTVIRYGRRIGLWLLAAVAILALGGGATAFVLAGDEPPNAFDAGSTTTGASSGSDAGTAAVDGEPGSGANSPGASPDPAASSGPTSSPDPAATTTGAAIGSTTGAAPVGSTPVTTTITTTVTTTVTTTITTTAGTAGTGVGTAAPTTSTVAILPPAVTVVGTTIPADPPATTATPSTLPPPAAPPTTAPPAPPTTVAPTAPPTVPPTTVPSTTVPPTTTPVPPGSLAVSTGSVDFGTTLDSVRITLSNAGGEPVDWVASTGPIGFRGAASPFAVSPPAGTLPPGRSVAVTLSLDRTWPTEGPLDGEQVTFSAAGTSAAVDLNGEIARPPELIGIRLPRNEVCPRGSPSASILAEVIDESAPVTGSFRLVDPAGVSADVPTDVREPMHSASLAYWDPDGNGLIDTGTWTWTLTATDAFGNRARIGGALAVETRFC